MEEQLKRLGLGNMTLGGLEGAADINTGALARALREYCAPKWLLRGLASRHKGMHVAMPLARGDPLTPRWRMRCRLHPAERM